MHIHIFSFVFLQTEIWIFEGGLKNVLTVVFDCVSGLDQICFLLLVLISQLLGFIVKILPNYISWLLLI